MTDPATNPKDVLKKLSRRTLLRNSAITATGAVLLPSFLTGCHKDVYDIIRKHVPNAGVGGVELTPVELAAAAANLTRLRAWITDLYPMCIESEEAVFHALQSSKTNENWTNFVVDIMIDIATLLIAAAAIGSGNPEVVPAIAFLSAVLHDWGIGKDKPNNLDAEFAVFEIGHQKMETAIEQKLSSLVDTNNNYGNLRAAWQDNIVFNGTSYTIGDLASSNFPGLGDEYNSLQTAALTSFKKSLWNLVIIKCCTLYRHYSFIVPKVDVDNPTGIRSAVIYGRENFYKYNPGSYLTGYYQASWNDYTFTYYDLGINGYPLPDTASAILFMDDTPGHIINPDGLFNRTYVFQQFHTTKPNFNGGHVLANDPYYDWADSDDFDFTGGLFPDLTH